MKGERLYIEWVEKNPAVLVGRPGRRVAMGSLRPNKKEGSYGKFKAD
ncbi:MAG: hypothetical protein ACO2O5_04210 [Candidatus Caldipriscus sp.]